MKRYHGILLMILSIATTCGIVGCTKKENAANYSIELQSVYDGAEVDLCTSLVRKYLDADSEEEQLQQLLANRETQSDYQPLLFSWSENSTTRSQTYAVYFAENENFDDAIIYETRGTILNKTGCFVPGKTYYWKVVGDAEGSTSKVDSFKTLDAPVRYITTSGIPNVRDIGGWKTEDGKTVRYEMLYRGGKTNPSGGNECMPEDKEIFANKLGIKTEIDLRTQEHDDGNQTKSVFGDDVTYIKAKLTQYSYIYPDFEQTSPIKRSYDKQTRASVKAIFETLADEKNYPIYFHCNAGADRTGTLTFLINGLLGVSYENLTKDFELTSFSIAGARVRSGVTDRVLDSSGVYQDDTDNYVAWGKMYEFMMNTYGTEDGTLSSAIAQYLIEVCGIEPETITSVRNIMLED